MERMLCGLGGLTVLVLLAIGLEIIRSRHLKAEIKKMDMLKKQSEEYYVQIQENNVDLQELSAALEEQKESVESLLIENGGKGDVILCGNPFKTQEYSGTTKAASGRNRAHWSTI